MTKFRQLLLVEAAALGSLVLFAGAMAGVAASNAITNPAALLSPGSAAWVTFAYTCLLGALPVVLYGAPGYWLLVRKGLARWYYALALGATPALAFLFVDPNLAFWALIAGGVVALITHALCQRLVPYPSFKPRP